MKKKLLLFIAAVITLGLVSCSEEETPVITDNTDVVGNWYEEAENEEVRFNENGTFYDKYCNVLKSYETEGRWEYDKANRKLTQTFSFMGQTHSNDWTVKDLTEKSFVIYSTTVAEHKYEKIVETYNLEVGGTANIQYSTNVTSYTSKNARLASVTSDGKITAEGEKGTTYIKVATNNGNVWVKVVVGDECLDLWYDYPSLIGTDIASVQNVLGKYSIAGNDGYSYGYILELNDFADELDIFLDNNTGLVDQMALVLKESLPESLLLNYLKSHYYPCTDLGPEYYTTSSVIGKSIAVIFYDKESKTIRFYNSAPYRLPDYTGDFGLTTDEIVKKYGELYLGVLPIYNVANMYISAIRYIMDDVTDKVTAYQCTVRDNISADIINKHLASQYNLIMSDGNRFGYGDGDTRNTSRIWLVYTTEQKTITFFDQDNYGKSVN